MPPIPIYVDAASSLARRHVGQAILRRLKDWEPIHLDALGLVSLLGAEEFNASIGTLQRRRYTEFLPFLAAFVVAGDRFASMESGYSLYNLTDAIYTTEVRGWFTRWLATQVIDNATTVFTFTVTPAKGEKPAENGAREHGQIQETTSAAKLKQRVARILALTLQVLRRASSRAVSVIIGLVSIMPLLICTILMDDKFGIVNACAIIWSVIVRVYLVAQRREAVVHYATTGEDFPSRSDEEEPDSRNGTGVGAQQQDSTQHGEALSVVAANGAGHNAPSTTEGALQEATEREKGSSIATTNGAGYNAASVTNGGSLGANGRTPEQPARVADPGLSKLNPPGEEKKILVIRSDGKMVTIYAPDTLVRTFTFEKKVRHPRLYRAVRWTAWAAFGAHIISLGMSSLFSQIYTVVVLVFSTWIFCSDLSYDIDENRDQEFKGRFSAQPFGPHIKIERRRPYMEIQDKEKRGMDRRQWGYARAQPTWEQDLMLKQWSLLPFNVDEYLNLHPSDELKAHKQRSASVGPHIPQERGQDPSHSRTQSDERPLGPEAAREEQLTTGEHEGPGAAVRNVRWYEEYKAAKSKTKPD